MAQLLMRTDPFREFDRLAQQLFRGNGTLAYPGAMPMDAWREGDTFVVEFDLPGIAPGRYCSVFKRRRQARIKSDQCVSWSMARSGCSCGDRACAASGSFWSFRLQWPLR